MIYINKNLIDVYRLYQDNFVETNGYKNIPSLPFDIPTDFTCQSSKLKEIYSSSEIENNDYFCFQVKNIFPYFIELIGADITYLDLVSKCYREGINICEQFDLKQSNFGFSLNYTKPSFTKSENFLENTFDNYNFTKLEFNYHSIKYDFHYNILKDNVGLFLDEYKIYDFLSKTNKFIETKKRLYSDKLSSIENTFTIEENIYVYTRTYKKILSVVRESFSILIFLSAIFKLIAEQSSNYYCEKYLYNFLYDNNLISSNKIEIKSYNLSAISIDADNNKEAVKVNNYIEEKNVNKPTYKDVNRYNHNICDYLCNLIPFASGFADSRYLLIQKIISYKTSVENII